MPESRLRSSFSIACLTAAGLEFALAAMPVQHKVGWQIVDQERGDVWDSFLHLAGQRKELHLPRRIAVAVHDLTNGHLASNRFGKYERVERERQRVVFGKLVLKCKMIWNELGEPAASFVGRLSTANRRNSRSWVRKRTSMANRHVASLKLLEVIGGLVARALSANAATARFSPSMIIGLLVCPSPLGILSCGDGFRA